MQLKASEWSDLVFDLINR